MNRLFFLKTAGGIVGLSMRPQASAAVAVRYRTEYSEPEGIRVMYRDETYNFKGELIKVSREYARKI